jgi:hypothetical protein
MRGGLFRDIISSYSVYRFHPDRVVAFYGGDWSRIITSGILHQRGEHVGRQFSRNPRADVAEDQLSKFAEWLHPGALLSGEAIRAGTVQVCDVVGVDTTRTNSNVRVEAVHELRQNRQDKSSESPADRSCGVQVSSDFGRECFERI